MTACVNMAQGEKCKMFGCEVSIFDYYLIRLGDIVGLSDTVEKYYHFDTEKTNF